MSEASQVEHIEIVIYSMTLLECYYFGRLHSIRYTILIATFWSSGQSPYSWDNICGKFEFVALAETLDSISTNTVVRQKFHLGGKHIECNEFPIRLKVTQHPNSRF